MQTLPEIKSLLPEIVFSISDSIFVKSKRRLERVNIKDIKWVESEDIYAILTTSEGNYILNKSLKTAFQRISYVYTVLILSM